MSIRLGTSTIRRTRPRFLRTRKLDWTDGIDFFLRLSLRARGATRHEPSRKEPRKGPGCIHEATLIGRADRGGANLRAPQRQKTRTTAGTFAPAAVRISAD